jgi:hypothetical protein
MKNTAAKVSGAVVEERDGEKTRPENIDKRYQVSLYKPSGFSAGFVNSLFLSLRRVSSFSV